MIRAHWGLAAIQYVDSVLGVHGDAHGIWMTPTGRDLLPALGHFEPRSIRTDDHGSAPLSAWLPPALDQRARAHVARPVLARLDASPAPRAILPTPLATPGSSHRRQPLPARS